MFAGDLPAFGPEGLAWSKGVHRRSEAQPRAKTPVDAALCTYLAQMGYVERDRAKCLWRAVDAPDESGGDPQ
jgi:hypothetical protein